MKKTTDYVKIIDKKINGMLEKSRAIHVEHNEKNTKYIANHEKRHYESNTIHKLTINNIEVIDINAILNEHKSFTQTFTARTKIWI